MHNNNIAIINEWYRSKIIEEYSMFKKWVVSITLSLALLSGVATGADVNTSEDADANVLVSYTDNIIHNNKGGGRGVDTIELIAPKTAKNSCAVYKHSEIKYKIRRFASAKIDSEPSLACDPKREKPCSIDISWKHSPAGRLDYKIKISWTLEAC